MSEVHSTALSNIINTHIKPKDWKEIPLTDPAIFNPPSTSKLKKLWNGLNEFTGYIRSTPGFCATLCAVSPALKAIPIVGNYIIPATTPHLIGLAVYRFSKRSWGSEAADAVRSGFSALGDSMNKLPPDNLIHLHNCLEQMQDPEFSEFDKAELFLTALVKNPKYFEIDGWSDEETKAMTSLVEFIPQGEGPKVEQYEETALKTFDLVHKKLHSSAGILIQLKGQTSFKLLKKTKASFKKIISLINQPGNTNGHFLRPAVVAGLQNIAQRIKDTGVDYLQDKDQQKALEDLCEKFIDKIGDAKNSIPLDEAFQDFLGQRIALFFGYQIPFTSPALEDFSKATLNRNKKAAVTKEVPVEELQKESAKFREDCIMKGSMVTLHWFFIQLIGGRDDIAITPCIEKAYKSHDPKKAFYLSMRKALDSSKISIWRKVIATLLWYLTPWDWLTRFLLEHSFHATESWCDKQRKRKQENVYHIPGAKSIESTFKRWVTANCKIKDIGSYEDEISGILANGKNRKVRINKFTNFLVDTCFPAIDLVWWHNKWDNIISKWHLNRHTLIKPFVWVISNALRLGLMVVKIGLLFFQKALNFWGRFIAKIIIKRLGVMHKLFDFRARLGKGDHHSIEDTLKDLALMLLRELNAINLDDAEPNDAEINQLHRVNQNVEQCFYALLRVLDMHSTHHWDKEGIASALKGSALKKIAYDIVVPTAIEQGVALLNSVVWQNLIMNEQKYEQVKCNLFQSFSEAMTKSISAPPERDEEIKNEIHEFRTKLIRQIILRTLADLGEDERKKAGKYVYDMQALKSEHADWQYQLDDIETKLTSHTAFDIQGFQSSIKKGLDTLDEIYKKYSRSLKSAKSKMNEIHNYFLEPTEKIEFSLEELNRYLQKVSIFRVLKNDFKDARAKWHTLKPGLALNSESSINAFIDEFTNLDLKTPSHRTSQQRKLALREKILCEIVNNHLEKVKDKKNWKRERHIGWVEGALKLLKIDPKIKDNELKTTIAAKLKKAKEAYDTQAPLPPTSLVELKQQLSALQSDVIENSNKLAPYSGNLRYIYSVTNACLEPKEDQDGTNGPIDRVFEKRHRMIQNVNQYLDKKSAAYQQKHANWLEDKSVFDALKKDLNADIEAFDPNSMNYSHIKIHLNNYLDKKPPAFQKKYENWLGKPSLFNDLKKELKTEPFDSDSANLSHIKEHLKNYFATKSPKFKQDYANWLENESVLRRLKEQLHIDQKNLGRIDIETEREITERINDALFNECVEKCQAQENIWIEKAEKEIDKVKKFLIKLKEKTDDDKLSIPYFNFVYSTDKDEDPFPIRFLIWFIGENAERITQKILKLSQHPVFFPWAFREAILPDEMV